MNKGGLFSLLGKSKNLTFLDYDRLQLKVGYHENLYAASRGKWMHQFVRWPNARLVCPPQGPIWVPFGVCVCLLGVALRGRFRGYGFPLWHGVSGGSSLGCPLTEIPLTTCLPAHPAPLIALSEGTQVASTFVRRCYDKMNTRFSCDCPFRMNIFPSQKHFVLYTATIYQRKKGFCKKIQDVIYVERGRKGGEGGDTK
jgi:hypothetical protein